jgi:hypothetical protein
MRDLIGTMIERLAAYKQSEVMSWAAPVPSFGNLARSSIATLGINPSNREFVDEAGNELTQHERRFHTLRSLKLKKWGKAGPKETELILDSCDEYFFRNPYNGWFKKLDAIISTTGFSYYDRFFPACHIDLVPFATELKWGTLPSNQRKALLLDNADLLKKLIQGSSLQYLILNGQSVVSEFEVASGLHLKAETVEGWQLPRSTGQGVPGIGYTGICHSIAGKSLSRPITILGFNHNIQSSFGVTTSVVRNIAKWVGSKVATERCQAA